MTSSKSAEKDCYLIDLEQNCLGPFTAAEAGEHLQLAPFGWLLIRAGFTPIWSEDLEGLDLVLKNSEIVDLQQISPPPPPPPRAESAPVPAAGKQILAAGGKAEVGTHGIPETGTHLLDSQNVFGANVDFEVFCTTHFQNQKRWFDALKSEKPSVPAKIKKVVPEEAGKRRFGSRQSRRSRGHAKLQQIKKALDFYGRQRFVNKLPLALLASATFVLFFVAINLAGGLNPFAESPYAEFDSMRGGGPEAVTQDPLNGARNFAGEKSLSAKGPAALRQLTRLIEAKLDSNFHRYSKELLSLLPHHEIFQNDLIPPPQAAAAWATLFLGRVERENHPSWVPLQRLLGADLQRGLSGQALILWRLEEIAARVSGTAYMSPMVPVGLYEWQGDSGQEANVLPGLSAVAPSRTRPASTESRAEDLSLSLKNLGATEAIYWGIRRPGPSTTSRMVQDAFDEFVSLMKKFDSTKGVSRSEYALRDYIVTRAQFLAAWFVLGLGQPNLTKKIQPIFEMQLQYSGDVDAAILAQLLEEASRDLVSFPLRERVEQRFALMRKLQIETGFFCKPLGTLLSMDFIAQSLRLAILADFRLPPLGQVLTSCLVTPAILIPTRSNHFFNEQEGLLDVLPIGGNTKLIEWKAYARVLRNGLDAAVSSGARLTFSNEWQWQAMLVFGSADDELQKLFSQVSLPLCKDQPDAALDPVCILVKWHQTPDLQYRQKKERLKQVEARFGLAATRELAFQWVLRSYLNDAARGKLPGDPVLFARRFEIERLLVSTRPHFNCLEWFAKHGVR